MRMNKIYGGLVATLAFTMMSCGGGMESKIQGKYELAITPGTTYEFASQGKFINESKSESMDCTIKSTGSWKVKGDSLYITNDADGVSYEFGDSVSEEDKEMIKGLFQGVSEAAPEQLAYKIVSVDDKTLKMEADGTTLTYNRMK